MGGMSTTTGGGMGGMSTTTGGGMGGSGGSAPYGYCAPPCTTPAECCPANTPGCPSNQYPNNYTCKDGSCRSPQCATTSDCTAEGPTKDCFMVDGEKSCKFACSTDTDCNAPQTCIGVDDNGKKYCRATGAGCPDDAFCMNLGIGKCINKVCLCEADADCTKTGFTKCAK